jgi:hypothetical protein
MDTATKTDLPTLGISLNVTGKALVAYRAEQAVSRSSALLEVFGNLYHSLLDTDGFALNADEFTLDGIAFRWASSFECHRYGDLEQLYVRAGNDWVLVKSLAHLGCLIKDGKVEG